MNFIYEWKKNFCFYYVMYFLISRIIYIAVFMVYTDKHLFINYLLILEIL